MIYSEGLIGKIFLTFSDREKIKLRRDLIPEFCYFGKLAFHYVQKKSEGMY